LRPGPQRRRKQAGNGGAARDVDHLVVLRKLQ
jgi:hypothetical protein